MHRIKRLARKPWFWLAVVISIIVLVLLVIWARNRFSRAFITEEWHRIVLSSYNVEDAVKRANYDEASIESLGKYLLAFERESRDVAFQASVTSSVQYNQSRNDELSSIATEVASYAEESQKVLSLVQANEVETSLFDELSSLEKRIDASYHDFNHNLRREDPLPPESLAVGEYLQGLDNYYQNEIKKTEQQQAEAKKQTVAQQEEEAREREAVQAVAASFLDGQKEGDPVKTEAAMTSGYAREFDFGSLEGEEYDSYRTNYYRINEIKQQDDGDYEVTASVTYISIYENREGEVQNSEYTYSRSYEVVLSPGGDKWLVNRELSS